ncbi:MAG: hypothetical protein M0024_11185 [Nitrospiraceae bacterium]|nr:hypothetical protein [Nitrospiraceae bacterium]
MAHSFTVSIAEEIGVVLRRMETALSEIGGSFQGNDGAGAFSGSTPLGPIKGEYRSIAGSEIRITIIEKPFLLPHSTIETEIRKYLSEVA